MSTNLIQEQHSFASQPDVLATLEGLRSPLLLTMDLAAISPDANGKKYLYSGSVLVKQPNGLGAPLKVSKVTAAATTSATTLTVGNAALFRAGDVLTVFGPYARLDLAGIWANADTASLTLDGQTVTVPVADYSSLTNLAIALASAFNTAPLFASRASFTADAQHVHIFGKQPYTVASGEATAGDGTLVVTGSATRLIENASVEVVQSVNTVTNTLTLAGTLDRRLPVNAGVGVLTGEIVGLHAGPTIDLDHLSNDVAVYTSATVWAARLPYWSDAIAPLLPEITLV
jgi:hypothetical protein